MKIRGEGEQPHGDNKKVDFVDFYCEKTEACSQINIEC